MTRRNLIRLTAGYTISVNKFKPAIKVWEYLNRKFQENFTTQFIWLKSLLRISKNFNYKSFFNEMTGRFRKRSSTYVSQ